MTQTTRRTATTQADPHHPARARPLPGRGDPSFGGRPKPQSTGVGAIAKEAIVKGMDRAAGNRGGWVGNVDATRISEASKGFPLLQSRKAEIDASFRFDCPADEFNVPGMSAYDTPAVLPPPTPHVSRSLRGSARATQSRPTGSARDGRVHPWPGGPAHGWPLDSGNIGHSDAVPGQEPTRAATATSSARHRKGFLSSQGGTGCVPGSSAETVFPDPLPGPGNVYTRCVALPSSTAIKRVLVSGQVGNNHDDEQRHPIRWGWR